jgi:DNA-binding response OmpR family regulator
MPHVLVIEDDPWIAWMIADDLAERGYRVSTASNGLEALQLLGHARPDVIVLDLMLPDMDGWTFVERYQRATGGTRVPIIVVSAAGAVPRSMEARGVQCYLRKPFDIQELAACVDQSAPALATRA